MKNALVVIDVQNCFVIGKAVGLPQKILDHIKHTKYDHIVFTKFRNDPNSNFHKILHSKRHMASPDIDIHLLLAPLGDESNTFEKLTYSAFKAPKFSRYLKQHDIQELFICGINIDGCVLATTYEAFDLGYRVKILEELCSVANSRDDYEQSAKTIIARNLKPRP